MKIEHVLAVSVAGLALSAVACAAPAQPDTESTVTRSSSTQAMMDDDGVDCSTCMGGECAELHCFEDWTHGGGGPGGPYTGDGSGGWGGGGSSGSTPTPPDDPNCLAQCDQHFYDCYVGLGRTPKAELVCIERLSVCTQACDAAQRKPLVTTTPRLR